MNAKPNQTAETQHLDAAPGGLLMRWLDGDVKDGERVRITAHLATCPACVREVRAYKALFRGVRTLPTRRAPAFLAARIAAAAELDRRSRRRMRWFEVAGSAYAAIAVSLLIGIGMSPWREVVFAVLRSGVASLISASVSTLVLVFNRVMWFFDAVVHVRETANALFQPLAPLGRSLEVLAAQPDLRVGMSLALVLTTLLWWWFNHRRVRGPGRMNDVSAFL